MSQDSEGSATPVTASRPWVKAIESLLLFVVLLAIYLANGREIGTGDTVPAKYLTVALIRGDGFYLDRYRKPVFAAWPGEGWPYYVSFANGRVVSRYPVGPSIVAVPFALPQVAFYDLTEFAWEWREPELFDKIAKRSAAMIAALTAVLLLSALRGLGMGREAWPTVIAASIGSNLWVTASQSLWQHGPAALCLISTVWLLLPEAPSRRRFALAGLASAMLVCCRPVDLAFAVTTALWVVFRHPRKLGWFLPAPMALAVALIAYNRATLGAAGGFYSNFAPSTFATPLFVGLAGTLFSPNRGLFVFSPWTMVAAAFAPWAVARTLRGTLAAWLIATSLCHALLVSKFTIWWAGHSFGPRFWTEVIPLLAIAFGSALVWSKAHFRPIYFASLALVAVAIAVQGVGAWAYPSSWDSHPSNIDKDTGRLWNWSDTELSRCLREGHGPPLMEPAAEAKKFEGVVKAPKKVGTLDRVDCGKIQGWAWDPREPDVPILVEIFDGETLPATVPANRPRQDLRRLGMGQGEHGFVFPTPDSLKDGQPHTIHARIAGMNFEMNSSPKTLKCP